MNMLISRKHLPITNGCIYCMSVWALIITLAVSGNIELNIEMTVSAQLRGAGHHTRREIFHQWIRWKWWVLEKATQVLKGMTIWLFFRGLSMWASEGQVATVSIHFCFILDPFVWREHWRERSRNIFHSTPKRFEPHRKKKRSLSVDSVTYQTRGFSNIPDPSLE